MTQIIATYQVGKPIEADSTPLVLLHALPLNAQMWQPVVEYLQGVPVITVDAPGFGNSVSEAALALPPSLQVFAQVLHTELVAQGVKKIVLAGLSMGGAAAAEFAALFPDFVQGLAIIDANITADDLARREFRESVALTAQAGRGYETVAQWPQTMLSPVASQEVREELARQLQALPNEGLAWAQRAMANRADRVAAVAQLQVPVLLARGVDDPTCTREMLLKWGVHASDPRYVEIADAGHFTALEQPAMLASVLCDFYADCV